MSQGTGYIVNLLLFSAIQNLLNNVNIADLVNQGTNSVKFQQIFQKYFTNYYGNAIPFERLLTSPKRLN